MQKIKEAHEAQLECADQNKEQEIMELKNQF
jgi:hypothetical protein